MKDRSEIIYSINIEDIQTVAFEEIERELTDDEIDNLIKSDAIADRIPVTAHDFFRETVLSSA